MYIFLDESKRLNKQWGKFILAWLVTNLRPSTIDKLYSDFLEHSWIKEKWWEIKSYDGNYRDRIDDFYLFLKESHYRNDIEFVWIYAKNYFETGENYYYCLNMLCHHILNYQNALKQITKVHIIADNIKLNYEQEDIKMLLNKSSKLKKFKIYKGFDFVFGNSKNYWGIKISDFIAWKLRNVFITEKEDFEKTFKTLFVNEEITIVKLKQ